MSLTGMSQGKHQQDESKIQEGELIQPETTEWISVGSKLLRESIEIGREYSKFMLTFSFSAIPLYLGFLKFIKGDTLLVIASASISSITLLLSPVLFFLLSSIFFIFAYYPKTGEVLIFAVEDIQNLHQRLMTRRRRMNFIATIIFVLSIVLSVVILVATF